MKKFISIALCLAMMAICIFSATSCDNRVSIGVQSGTTGEYFVNGDEDWGFDGIAGYKAKGYTNPGLAINDMKNGAVDYVIVDEAPALQIAKKTEGIKVIDVKLTDEVYAFGVDKNQPELLASINNILATSNTEIEAIFNAYATGEGIVAVASATQDDSKAATQLVMATNAQFAPFEYVEGDKFAGIDVAIMKLVADKLGMELVIKDMDFEAVVTSVGKNNVDVAAAALTVNDTRKESVNFTDSYYNAAQRLVVPASNTDYDNCKTVQDVLDQLAKDLEK